MTGSPQPKRLKRSSSGMDEADGSTSSSSSASADQPASPGGCDLTTTTTSSTSLSLPSTSSFSASSLSTFWHLPQEIKDRIFALACSLPSADVANLALASPIFHAQANAALWSNIRLTRPSALTRLHDTIAARPELGLRVRNLHVGPEEEAPALHTPHRAQSDAGYRPPLFISTSLRTATEAQLLPRWCHPGQEWRAALPDNPDCCRSTAVFKALQEVQRSLNIDLAGNKADHNRTLPRLYEAQAALDLYLMQMRRVEESGVCKVTKESGCTHDGNCPRYPSLLIIGTATQPEMPQVDAVDPLLLTRQDLPDPYVLKRQDLLDHLDRPGSPQDRFDHPVVVARSNLEPKELRTAGTRPLRWKPDSRYESAEPYSPTAFNGAERPNHWQSGPDVKAVDLESSRAVLRKLLCLTPKLENLSLAGNLGRGCLTRGEPRGLRMPRVKGLGVGPPLRLRYWNGDMLDFQHYKQVESLHLCGFLPAGEHIAKVGSLKRLKEFRWTLTDDLVEEELFRLGVILDALTGRKGAAADAAAAKAVENKRYNNLQPAVLKKLRAQKPRQTAQKPRQTAQKPRQAGQRKASRGSTSRDITPQDEDDQAASINNTSLPLIEVRLRPEALLAMLQRAATQEERTAWTTGTLWPGCNQTRRLLLTEIPAVRSFTSEGKPQHPLFEAAREWWEEHRAV